MAGSSIERTTERRGSPGVAGVNGVAHESGPAGMANLAYLTSMKETIGDESSGQINSATGLYQAGTAEHLAGVLSHPHNRISQMINLVLIVTDDDPARKNEVAFVPPYSDIRPWPATACVPVRDSSGMAMAGHSLDGLVVNVPSTWRRLPLSDVAGRSAEKQAWEEEIVRVLYECNVDIVMMDSFLPILGRGIPDESGLLPAYDGRILNLHPAITEVNNPNRLPGLFPTRDALSRAHHGYILDADGNKVVVPIRDRTGATLHLVDRGIDTGLVVHSDETTVVLPDDTIDSLRFRNYVTKLHVAVEGLMTYLLNPRNVELIAAGRAQRSAALSGRGS